MLSYGAYAEFFTLGAIGVGSLVSFISYKARCSFMECCNDDEIPYNTNGKFVKNISRVLLIFVKFVY